MSYIRQYHESDLKEIISLFQSCVLDIIPNNTHSKTRQKSYDWIQKQIQEDLQCISQKYLDNPSGPGCFYVVEDKELPGKIIGMIGVRPNSQREKAEMLRLYVNKNYRRQGIATALLNKVIGFCQNSNYKELHLTVTSWNKEALQFYSKYEFVEDRSKRIICPSGIIYYTLVRKITPDDSSNYDFSR
jgi:ribosomal protein S18 acetylase RimI-like enzyme